jgi:hypothetical protein
MSNLRPMKHRLTLVVALVVAAVGLSACGGGHLPANEAESEGQYFEVGDLKYQVQISRQINPTDLEDKQYLSGIAASDLKLNPDQTFFGVFMRVENKTGNALTSAGEFVITDTQGNKFSPVPLANPFAYRVEAITPDGGTQPDQIEPAHYAPTQGKLLLFKLPNTSLDNRPLVMEVKAANGKYRTGDVTLDV